MNDPLDAVRHLLSCANRDLLALGSADSLDLAVARAYDAVGALCVAVARLSDEATAARERDQRITDTID